MHAADEGIPLSPGEEQRRPVRTLLVANGDVVANRGHLDTRVAVASPTLTPDKRGGLLHSVLLGLGKQCVLPPATGPRDTLRSRITGPKLIQPLVYRSVAGII